ncbi:PA14 domain-containing protein [Acrocarpospora corrugata]|nr:PA14 domain-containing protein [Acrocarpospora corrugata]
MTANSAAITGAGYTGLVAQPSWGRVTRKGNKLYLVVNAWAGTLHLSLRSPFTVTGARVLGSASPVTVRAAGDGNDFLPSGSATNAIATVIEADITTPTPAAAGTGSGLKAEFWSNTTFTGTPAVTRTDPTVNYAWRFSGSPAASIGTDNFSSRWTGSIQPRYSERYTFTTASDDTVRLWIDGQLVIDNATPHTAAVDQGSVTLVAGRRYDIRLEQTERGSEAFMKLSWRAPAPRPRSCRSRSCTPQPARPGASTTAWPPTAPAGPPAAPAVSVTTTTTCATRPPTARRSPSPAPAPASTSCPNATPIRARWRCTSTAYSRPPPTPPAAPA